MMRKLGYLVVLAVVLLLNACSNGNSDSPNDTEPHPQKWFSSHPDEADESTDYADCGLCHGPDLQGSGDAVSCYSCHSYNTKPPFSFHPPDWTDDFIDHRAYATFNGNQSCKSCHGSKLKGYQSAPSCYSANYNGQGCHADGPQGVPHPLDSSYLSGVNHGPDAKTDLTSCQQCHGEQGGPGSNPRFNIGIYSAGGHGCESCHGVDYAHPEDWALGPDEPVHFAAGNVQNACTLCHGVNLDGSDAVGVSCLDCHNVSPGAYPGDCVSCHGAPPNSNAPVNAERPNLEGLHYRGGHSIVISLTPSETCNRCHLGGGSGTANHYDTSPPADLTLPLEPLDTIVPVWDGTNMTCNGNCHVVGPYGEHMVPHFNSKWYQP
jgi:hypothetical protein